MFNSLRTRLIVSYILLLVVCLLIIGLSLLFFFRSSAAVERFDMAQLEVARAAVRGSPPPLDATLQALSRYALDIARANDARVLFTDEAGRVLIDSAVLAGDAPSGDITRIERDARGAPNRGTVRDSSRRLWIYLSQPGGQRGLQMIFARQRTLPINFLIDNLLTPLLQAAAIGVVLSLVMALLIAHSVTDPLRKLSRAAGEIARGNFDHTAPVGGPTEVRSLAHSFNEMIARVNASHKTLRDFVANVSHELKTPLTSIQGFSQAILDGAAGDPEAVRRSAHIVNDEADRMRRMVDGLLDLARLDAGQAALHRAPTDLAALLRSLSEKLSLRAAESKIALAAEIGPLPAMIADGDRLAQVFANLLDNALKHTPAGGRVTFAAQADASAVVVTVTDTGRGIPAEDLPRIFERFYRVDKSRAAGRGYGLGLAISKEIVQAHGGTISAESVQGLGTKFTVRLPVAPGDDTTAIRRRA